MVLTASISGIALSVHLLLHVPSVPSTVAACAIVRPQPVLGVPIAVCRGFYIPVMAVDARDYFTRALTNLMNGTSGRALVPARALAAPGTHRVGNHATVTRVEE